MKTEENPGEFGADTPRPKPLEPGPDSGGNRLRCVLGAESLCLWPLTGGDKIRKQARRRIVRWGKTHWKPRSGRLPEPGPLRRRQRRIRPNWSGIRERAKERAKGSQRDFGVAFALLRTSLALDQPLLQRGRLLLVVVSMASRTGRSPPTGAGLPASTQPLTIRIDVASAR